MARNVATKKPEARSAVSNGNQLFGAFVDCRTVVARRYRDLVEDFSALTGTEGPDAAQLSLIRRIAAISYQCEQDEARMVSGAEYDGELYIRRANILGGLIARLGLAKPANTRAKGDNAKTIDGHASAILGEPG